MNRAPLHRDTVSDRGNRALQAAAAIHDEELGAPQAAPDEIVQHRAPGLAALATHALDRQEHLRAVAAHSDDLPGRVGPRCTIYGSGKSTCSIYRAFLLNS